MTSFAAPAVRHWDFRRGVASVALMVRHGTGLGADPRQLLTGSGLAPEQVSDPNSEVEAWQELQVVRNLAVFAPTAGLAVGRRYHTTAFGVLGYAFLSSPTVLAAFDLALRYLDLSFSFTMPSASIDDDVLFIQLDDKAVPADLSRFLLERDLAAIHTVLSDLVGTRLATLSVQFPFDEPADVVEYVDFFGVRPHFGRTATASAFDSALLTRELPLASPGTIAACEAQCARLAARRRDRLGVARTVRELLNTTAEFDQGMTSVARTMKMSPRTLRRHLAASGTSYHELLDEVRARRAAELLTENDLPVSKIAEELGYAETGSFVHAFHRWYRTTPAAFSRSHRAR